MRLGLVLLVALLLPFIAKADFSRTSVQDEPSEYGYNTAAVSNSVDYFHSKPTSSTSKSRNSANSIFYNKNGKHPMDVDRNFTNNISDNFYEKNSTYNDEMEYLTTESVYNNKKALISDNLKKEPGKTEPLQKKKELTVGYLTAAKGELKERQGLSISGALTLALEEVSSNSLLLFK